MNRYTLYGISIATSLDFRFPLPPSDRPVDLHLTESYGTLSLDQARLLSTTPEAYVNGAGIQAAYRLGDADVLLCLGGDQMVIRHDAIEYRHVRHAPIQRDFVEVRLVGSALAWWLLQAGRLPLHAGALQVDDGAVLFVAESGMGKSSLMASLVGGGIPLLSDDFVTVQRGPGDTLSAAAAYPQMRLWPETIERFIGSAAPFPTVFEGGNKRRVAVGNSWGSFLEGLYPLTRIYLLQRQGDEHGIVHLERVAGHEGFMSLLASILLGPSFPLEELQRIWPLLQQCADEVPIYRMTYPTGWQWLPEVQRAVMRPHSFLR